MPQRSSIESAANPAPLVGHGRQLQVVTWPAVTPLHVERAAAALERIRSDARAVFELLRGSRHHARAVVMAKANDIAGLARRSLISLAENHIDILPKRSGIRRRR
jgi:hypothetical protein